MSVLIVKKPSESDSSFVGRGAYKDNRGAKSLFWVRAHRSVPGGPPGQSDPADRVKGSAQKGSAEGSYSCPTYQRPKRRRSETKKLKRGVQYTLQMRKIYIHWRNVPKMDPKEGTRK